MVLGTGSASNLQAQWARLLLGSLADAGVREVVLSPGSRSTPFVLAALEQPKLRCHDVIDERAAGFFALGMARRSGRPALLLCTSGTAAANYLPAVVEAGASHVPLLVLSADRPVELAHCAANQTIDQLKLFGDHARRFFDLGLADATPRALRALRRTLAQGVAASLHPLPGAVHFNARARKPLEPPTTITEADTALETEVDQLLARPIVRPALPRIHPDPGAIKTLAEACERELRGLIVLGPRAIGYGDQPTVGEDPEGELHERRAMPGRSVSEGIADAGGPNLLDEDRLRVHRHLRALSQMLGFPILADPASQLRYRGSERESRHDPAPSERVGGSSGEATTPHPIHLDTYDALLRQARVAEALAPRLILQVGRGPTSGAWERFLERHAEAGHWVLAEHGWPDAASTADHLVWGHLPETLDRLRSEIRLGPATLTTHDRWRDNPWLDAWLDADWCARRALDQELAAGRGLSEGGVARAVVRALDDGGLLVVGNSLPIRQLDLWAPGPGPRLHVASQRGTSGIDGLLSGAAGAALIHDAPAVLLVGDVSFLHDLSGLVTARRVDKPLALVVVQNRGGRIFEQLPVARHPRLEHLADGTALDHWLTPHDADFELAARLHHLPFARVQTPEALEAALARALKHDGATVIEAVVPVHGAIEQTQALGERLARALEDWTPPSAEP